VKRESERAESPAMYYVKYMEVLASVCGSPRTIVVFFFIGGSRSVARTAAGCLLFLAGWPCFSLLLYTLGEWGVFIIDFDIL